MKSRLLLLLLALLVAASGATLFLRRDSGAARTPEEGIRATGSSEPAPTPPETLPAPEQRPLSGLDANSESKQPTRVAVGETNPDATFATENARIVPIRVILPPGVPTDDKLWLYEFAHPDAAPWGDFERRTASNQFEGSDTPAAYLEQRGIVWARRQCKTSGEVKLPFPPQATGATVLLFSHYVISEPVTFSLGTPPPTIEGTLGAWVTGRVLFPEESILEDPQPETLRVRVFFQDPDSFSPLLAGESLEVRPQQDSRYSLPRLPTDGEYTLLLPAKGRLDYTSDSLHMEPGEHVTLDLPLEVGAAVTGIVVDEDGVGIASAGVLGTSANSLPASQNGGEEGMTGEDGVFRLAGLPPGEIELKTVATGWRTEEPTRISVDAGEVATGVRIVLNRGNEISGHVLGPDGQPVEGAEVFTEDAGILPWNQRITATTDAEGAFLLSGLGEGPFDVTATSDHGVTDTERQAPEQVQRSSSGSRADHLRWFASAKAVHPNARDVELVLSPPQSVRGFVVDDTGSPIPSFEVEAFEVGKERERHLSTAPSQTEAGVFELSGVHEGEWILRVTSHGYFPVEDHQVPIRIPQGDVAIEIVLRRAVSVSGLVVAPDGTPVPGARVSCNWLPGASGSRLPRGGVGPDGRFELENIPPTGTSLVARSDTFGLSEPFVISGEPGAKLEDVVLTLGGGGTIVGEVLDEAGRPDVGVGIQVIDSRGESISRHDVTARTDEKGNFRIEHVPAGKVHLVTAPNKEAVMEGLKKAKSREEVLAVRVGKVRSATATVVSGKEVHVRLEFPDKKPVHVTGTVLEAGRPVPGAAVLAFEEGVSLWNGLEASLSDSDGRFELTLDRPGDYIFRVRDEGQQSLPIPLRVTVPDVPTFSVKLNLPMGILAGVVLSPAGDPVADLPLQLRRPKTLPGILFFDAHGTVRTSEDGHFRFEHVEPGRVALLAGGNGPPSAPQTTRYATTVLGNIVLGKGEMRDDLVLRLSEGGTIDGYVRDTRGHPVPGAAIFVRDGAGELLSTVAEVWSDASGSFSYPHVPVGDAWVFARKDNLASSEVGPLAVHVEQSSSTDLILRAGCFLTVVFEIDGEPARATIHVSDGHGRPVGGASTSDPFATFYGTTRPPREQRFGPLPSGTYTVSGEAPGGHTGTREVTLDEDGRERKITLQSD